MSLSWDQRRAVERIVGAHVVAAADLEERAHILRVRLDDGRAVIVKRLRAEGKKRFDGDVGFDREWAALAHVRRSGVAPRFLGGDRDASVLVLAELPPGRSLADSLLANDPGRATTDLMAYATTLARLNSVAPFSSERSWRLAAVDGGRAAFGDDAAVDAALAALDAGRVGVVHGDACPDNVRIGDNGACQIFDFEFASGGPVALDAVYLVAPFPSCWCFAPLPDTVVADALAAYRSVLPLDERELDAAVVANAVSALGRLTQTRAEDAVWGLTSMRPRLMRWLEACEQQQAFPAAARAAGRLVTRLHTEWGEVTAPPYPAFADYR